jgi:hypothetical protein
MDIENFLTPDFSGECLADILEAHKRGDVVLEQEQSFRCTTACSDIFEIS